MRKNSSPPKKLSADQLTIAKKQEKTTTKAGSEWNRVPAHYTFSAFKNLGYLKV